MPHLRKTVQYFFAAQALGSLIGVSSVLTALLTHGREWADLTNGPVVFGIMAAANLVFVAFGSIPAIAWWTLKRRKSSGRVWAIVASVLSLPIPVLSSLMPWMITAVSFHLPRYLPGTVIGIAGLVAYWRAPSESVAPKRPKPPRMSGDGTSKLTDYIAQGISAGIVWISFACWSRWAMFHRLHYPGLLAFIVQMELAILLCTFGHELGHLVAGWASRKRLRSFHVGPFQWAIRNGAWKFTFDLRKFYGGSVAMVAPDLMNMRSRKAFSLLGGPVASLAMGSFFAVVTLVTPGHSWQQYWLFLSMLATFSISSFLVNLIPLRPDGLYSDGAQLYQVVTNGPWAQVHLAFAMVTAGAVSPVTPRDFDVSVINKAADFIPHGERGLLLRLFACKHYLDTNQIPKAIASLQAAEVLYPECTFQKPEDICAEFVFINAFHKRDLAAADGWWRRMEALPRIDKDADYWRAQAALLWLRGERAEAREAWQRGNALALKLPASGAYAGTRACFTELRAALDAPVEKAPPPLDDLSALAVACEAKLDPATLYTG